MDENTSRLPKRYILIDNKSRSLWGDSYDIPGRTWNGYSPAEYVRAFDENDGFHGRTYEEVHISSMSSNESGYHVYLVANASFLDNWDGDLGHESITAVLAGCAYVTSFRITSAKEDRPC